MSRTRDKIGQLIREAGTLFTTTAAAKILNITNIDTAKTLSRWVKQGWLTRVRRGLYAVVPIEALDTHQTLENAWALAPALYSPCYIGGWSATEYWDFTEQLFHDICVFTEQPVTHKKQCIHNVTFLLTHMPHKHHFGTKIIWKENKKIEVSDPHKTIVDGVYNPLSCGGIQHLIDCFKEYIKSPYHSPEQLVMYAMRMESGTVFKRLGYLYSEITKTENELTTLCQKKLTQGISCLDPSIKEGTIITRWRLKIPKQLQI